MKNIIFVFLVFFISLGWTAGNYERGRQKNAQCQGCHGIPDQRIIYPSVYSVPKLGGQHAAYIVKALQEYKNMERPFQTMQAVAANLSDQDIEDLAAYYGQQVAKTK